MHRPSLDWSQHWGGRGTWEEARDEVSESQAKVFPRCNFRVAETGRADGAEWVALCGS